MTRIAANGVHLNAEVSGNGPPVLLLHGFTGSAATWSPLRAWPGFTLVAADILGHGESDSPADFRRYRMERCAEDILTLMDHLRIEKAAVLGYSMGGRLALHLAAHAPERLTALVLESASPGIEDEREREARRRSDEELASAIEAGGLEAFVDRWEALPLFASQTRLPSGVREGLRRQRLRNNPAGLANSLRGMGAGVQPPLWNRLPEMRAPALLIAGALDEKYCELAHRMATSMPNARLEIAPEAGHAVHLEQPELFASAVRRFLEDCLRTQLEEAARCP